MPPPTADVGRNPLYSKINKIINTDIDGEPDLLDALNSVSAILPANTLRSRRNLRSDGERHHLKLYESYLSAFKLVKDNVDDLASNVSGILDACHTINDRLSTLRRTTQNLICEASELKEKSSKVAARLDVLEAVDQAFRLSPEEAQILATSAPISPEFLAALHRAHTIEKNCLDLVQKGEQNIGLSFLDVIHKDLDTGYQRLYQWVQNECRGMVHETPEIPSNVRKAMSELQSRPVLFKYTLDEYAGARRGATVRLFIDALTRGSGSNPVNLSGHSKPIEIHSHDPLRYTSDMLAYMHQLSASEKESITTLAHDCHDPAISSMLSACLDGITESFCTPFKMRMEQLLVAQQDAVLLYRINNVLRFYEHTLSALLGTSAAVSTTLNEIQELSWRLLFSGLHQYAHQALEQPEYPSADLTPSDTARDTLQLLTEIIGAHDISLVSKETRQTMFKKIIDTLITPLIAYCQNSAEQLTQAAMSNVDLLKSPENGMDAESLAARKVLSRAKSATYLANCLYLIEITLGRLNCTSDQIAQIGSLFDMSLDELVAAQVLAILKSTHLEGLVCKLEQGYDASRDGPLSKCGFSEAEVSNALAHFDVYLSNPDRFSLPELKNLNVQRLRKVVRRRSADEVHSRYQMIYNALVNPANEYTSLQKSDSSSSTNIALRTPKQVADLILNF
ncbi:unnamed protein product [Calicophoron daubneyi]|uniref:Conserved oligomeric Golgi complex subunit 6 n=1 Tax=Calicophoron daubneyi TaxID=300641 RepID=A0AAV2T7X9_CALDB